MKHVTRILVVLCVLWLCAACGDDSNDGGGNNAADTGMTNNQADAGTDSASEDSGAGGGVTATGATCDETEFSACGGELTGTWGLTGGCVTPTALPRYTDCEPVAIDVNVSPTGEISFSGDGSFSATDFFFDTELDATVPKSCLAEGETCVDNEIDDDGVDAGDACQFNYGHDLAVRDPGTFTAEGGDGTHELIDGDGFAAGNFEYCVDGDTLTLRRIGVSAHDARLVLTKQ